MDLRTNRITVVIVYRCNCEKEIDKQRCAEPEGQSLLSGQHVFDLTILALVPHLAFGFQIFDVRHGKVNHFSGLRGKGISVRYILGAISSIMLGLTSINNLSLMIMIHSFSSLLK